MIWLKWFWKWGPFDTVDFSQFGVEKDDSNVKITENVFLGWKNTWITRIYEKGYYFWELQILYVWKLRYGVTLII